MLYQILTIGNPNSGKTTLFNALTGAKQRVGNWAGVTVDKKTGRYNHAGDEFLLTDLPGIYSLDSSNDVNSVDEMIASKAALSYPTDLIINVVDASCLERSLYMTLQLRELGRPMVVVLNKMDVLARQRQVLDVKKLEKVLGCPVLALSANSKEQVGCFKQKLHSLAQKGVETTPLELNYGKQIEAAITELDIHFAEQDATPRSLAVRALENDSLVHDLLSLETLTEVVEIRRKAIANIEADFHIANVRYTHLHELCKQVRRQEGKLSRSFSDKVDQVVLNKFVGIPFFFAVMYLMFMFSINIGGAFIDFFDISFGSVLVDGGHFLLDDILPVWMVTVIADGIGGGIQTVATFIPVIGCLYLFLTLLESSGYMARAAFVLDKVMQKIGLPGKAFVPLVLGFGCSVPAIMATRTLEHERERRLSAAMAPFMSCGARLPVYALFSAAFFPQHGQNIVFGLYIIGILVAVMTGMILRWSLYPGRSDSFIMEMPDYELPTMQNMLLKTWQKLKRFVLGAGKTIVLVVAVLSFFNSLGTDGSFGNEETETSILSQVAQVATPLLSPIGIEEDNWQATVGIITGIFAKEAVIGTLNSLYSTAGAGDESEYDLLGSLKEAVMSIPDNLAGLSYSDPLGVEVGDLTDMNAVAEDQDVDVSLFGNLKENFTSDAAAFAFLIFVLLYTPCAATMGAYVREFGRKFAWFIAAWTMFLAYFFATMYYQIAAFSTHPATSAGWIVFFTVLMLAVIAMLKNTGNKMQLQEEQGRYDFDTAERSSCC
jgi:ferrous iron transport protein B